MCNYKNSSFPKINTNLNININVTKYIPQSYITLLVSSALAENSPQHLWRCSRISFVLNIRGPCPYS